MGAEIDDKDI